MAERLHRPELVCPAGTPAALRTAVDAGADAVYCGFQNATNARNFPGLNFTPAELEEASPMRTSAAPRCCWQSTPFRRPASSTCGATAIDHAAKVGVDAMIVADIGVADYAAKHLSGPAAASVGAGRRLLAGSDPLLLQAFGIKRVVLPRMLTVAEIAERAQARSPARSKPSSSAISA